MSGWGSNNANAGGGGSNSFPLPFVPGKYDRFVLTRDSCSSVITEIKAYRNNILVVTIQLLYDQCNNLIEAVAV